MPAEIPPELVNLPSVTQRVSEITLSLENVAASSG